MFKKGFAKRAVSLAVALVMVLGLFYVNVLAYDNPSSYDDGYTYSPEEGNDYDYPEDGYDDDNNDAPYADDDKGTYYPEDEYGYYDDDNSPYAEGDNGYGHYDSEEDDDEPYAYPYPEYGTGEYYQPAAEPTPPLLTLYEVTRIIAPASINFDYVTLTYTHMPQSEIVAFAGDIFSISINAVIHAHRLYSGISEGDFPEGRLLRNGEHFSTTGSGSGFWPQWTPPINPDIYHAFIERNAFFWEVQVSDSGYFSLEIYINGEFFAETSPIRLTVLPAEYRPPLNLERVTATYEIDIPSEVHVFAGDDLTLNEHWTLRIPADSSSGVLPTSWISLRRMFNGEEVTRTMPNFLTFSPDPSNSDYAIASFDNFNWIWSDELDNGELTTRVYVDDVFLMESSPVNITVLERNLDNLTITYTLEPWSQLVAYAGSFPFVGFVWRIEYILPEGVNVSGSTTEVTFQSIWDEVYVSGLSNFRWEVDVNIAFIEPLFSHISAAWFLGQDGIQESDNNELSQRVLINGEAVFETSPITITVLPHDGTRPPVGPIVPPVTPPAHPVVPPAVVTAPSVAPGVVGTAAHISAAAVRAQESRTIRRWIGSRTFVQGSDDGLTKQLHLSPSEISDIRIGNAVLASEYFSIGSDARGFALVDIAPEFLDGLDVGSHTITFTLNTGARIRSTFRVN